MHKSEYSRIESGSKECTYHILNWTQDKFWASGSRVSRFFQEGEWLDNCWEPITDRVVPISVQFDWANNKGAEEGDGNNRGVYKDPYNILKKTNSLIVME